MPQNKTGKIKIFVAFSYDLQDKKLADRIIEFITKDEFGFEPYVVGHHTDVSFLDEQIQKNIQDSEGIFAIFTRRFAALDQNHETALLPPPMVISEISFAMGRYYGLHKKGYAAMYEEGILPRSKDLGLIAMRPLRLIPFDRDSILHKKRYLRNILQDYLISFRKQIEEPEQLAPYIQNTIEKTVYLYSNGTAISEIQCRATIINADEFNGIEHLIYINVPGKTMPDFNSMKNELPKEKPIKPFFSALIKKLNNEDINISFDVMEREGRDDRKIPLTLNLPYNKLPIKSVNPNLTIDYVFAWGCPNLYRTKFDTSYKYDEFRLQTTYGRLEEVGLKLVVEKGYKFSKKPFLSISQSIDDSASFGKELNFHIVDESIIYDTYSYDTKNFFGTLRVQWVPK